MNKVTKMFFDSEFTGLNQKTTLISIGFVSEDKKGFYAEFTDYDKSQVDDWVRENIIKNLLTTSIVAERNTSVVYSDILKNDTFLPKTEIDKVVIGDKKLVTKHLLKWLSKFKNIEMWSDCLSYDWVLFCDLFGGALKIPKNIYYLPFDICTMLKCNGIDPDINREDFAELNLDLGAFGKHNSLWDAFVIKACYEKLRRF